jgi:hypothetical protein
LFDRQKSKVNQKEQSMESQEVKFIPLAAKTIVVHTVTYSMMGLLASTLLDYGSWYSDDSSLALRVDSDILG